MRFIRSHYRSTLVLEHLQLILIILEPQLSKMHTLQKNFNLLINRPIVPKTCIQLLLVYFECYYLKSCGNLFFLLLYKYLYNSLNFAFFGLKPKYLLNGPLQKKFAVLCSRQCLVLKLQEHPAISFACLQVLDNFFQ